MLNKVMQRTSILKKMCDKLTLGVLSASGIALSFVFQWAVITQVGPGMETDALFAGMTFPQFVLAVISTSLAKILIPILAGESNEMIHFESWNFLGLVGLIFSAFSLILFFSATVWVPISVPGFSNEGKELTITLTRIQLIGMVFSAINSVQIAVYNAKHKFVYVEVVAIGSNALSVAALFVFLPRYGVISAAWIATTRIVFQTMLLSPEMGCPKIPKMFSTSVHKVWNQLKFMLLGSAYYQTNSFLERFLLSNAQSGSVSVFYLAQQIYTALLMIIYKSIVAPSIPKMSLYVKRNEIDAFWRQWRLQILKMIMISTSIVVVLVLFGEFILAKVFLYFRLNHADVHILWVVLTLMCLQLIIGSIGNILNTPFFVFSESKLLTKAGVLSYTLALPIKFILFKAFGLYGLALATSVYFVISLVILMSQIRSRWL